MFERIKRFVETWKSLKEVDTMSDRELEDLGMSRDQVRRFVQMPADIADRVAHMAAIFGLSEADLHRNHDAYVELLESCGQCSERKACAQVLALGPEARPEQCGFCRNARTFADAA